jgi:signal transduction histidine kinase
MAATARLLGEHLGADRCAYAEVEADEDTFTITGDYTHGDTASIVGRFTFAAFGAEVLRLMRANAPYVVDDAWADPRVTAADRAAYAATQIRAVVCVPLHKAGRLAAAMAVHQRRPRRWAPDEVELVVTVVQRCWESLERARAYRDLAEREAALAAASAQLAERTAAAEQARRVAEDERRGAEEARRTAEEANAAKAQFLANMSHELRTPLNAIGGYVQLVELGVHGPVTDAQRGALARVQQAQRHLLGLITEILDYAKVEGGRVEYDVRPVDAREVVAAVAPLVEPLFRAKGLAYAVRLPDAPVLVWADRERLGQVLVNLLSNAAKFTAAKDVGADPGPAGGAGVVVEVSPGADAEADAVVVDVAERLAGPAGPGARRRVPPRARHGTRHRARPAGARVRAVRPARHAVRRRRARAPARPGDQPRPGARHGRRPARAQHRGRGLGVHGDAAPRGGRGRAADRPPGRGRAPRGRAPGRGRRPTTRGGVRRVGGRGHPACPRLRARRGGARGHRRGNGTGGRGRRWPATGRR